MTLTEFLEQRLAEDEAKARADGADAMTGHRWKAYPEAAYEELQSATLARCKRVLREVEAKRAIVRDEPTVDQHEDCMWQWDQALRHLAAVYADHPDYRDEWRG
jgi:hypothetical protein